MHYRTLKVEYHGRTDYPLNTLTRKNVTVYRGKYRCADQFVMENDQTSKTTELNWKDQYQTGLADVDFNRNTGAHQIA